MSKIPKTTIKGSSIKVCVRVRPLVRRERENGEFIGWKWENHKIQLLESHSSVDKEFTFDHLFTTEHTTDDIYRDVISEIVANAMLGYHGSVFSYGQTASGKTYTMNGTAKQPGVIPIAIFDAFNAVEQFPDRIFLFRVCYLEVYKEQIKDLLNPDPTSNANIKIQFDEETKVAVVRGVKEQVVMNAVQVMSLLQSGEMYRHVGQTDMNEQSSRAHTIFRLIIESKDANGGPRAPIRTSTLNLIDLAGSENARMSNSTGERALEAKAINQSLLTLSVIIQRLSEMKKGDSVQHFPYRDSKLTRILQEPLSGNAFVAIVCTVSPSARCIDETTNTFRFASRAKKVNLSAQVNEGENNTLISRYEEEIANLKAKILQMEAISGGGGGGGIVSEEEELDEREERDNLLRMIEEMNRYIIKADGTIAEARERSILDKVISKWKNKAGVKRSESMFEKGKDDLAYALADLRLASEGGAWLHNPSQQESVGAFEAAAANGQSAGMKGPREILSSVSSMLDILKEKVDKKPVRKLSLGRSVESHSEGTHLEMEKLKLDYKLRVADATFLEQEVARKDAMLQQLVEGLRDVESKQQVWEEELNATRDLLELEKDDNAFLREKIQEYLELSDPAAHKPSSNTGGGDEHAMQLEIERLRQAVLLERAEADNLKEKIKEVSEDRTNWRHKYMLLSAQKKI